MALTASRELDRYTDLELRTQRVGGGENIYKGALVSVDSSGYAAPLASGEPFVGVAYEACDNSAGDDAAKSVRVYTQGDWEHALSGAAITDAGRPVFASADDTLTFSGNGSSYVGVVQDLVSSGKIILRIDPMGTRVKTVTHAVEDLDAGADIAARAIHCFNVDGWIVAARVVNQASAAAGIDDSNTCVIALAIDAGEVVSKTYNSSVTFPAANTADDLGTLAYQHAYAGNIVTLAVTNGATANPGPFLLEVDYV
jgi:hypothetical protein